jgi:hypothetical protein
MESGGKEIDELIQIQRETLEELRSFRKEIGQIIKIAAFTISCIFGMLILRFWIVPVFYE